jgi:NADH:ubiquinone oxidoreductase subunit H
MDKESENIPSADIKTQKKARSWQTIILFTLFWVFIIAAIAAMMAADIYTDSQEHGKNTPTDAAEK